MRTSAPTERVSSLETIANSIRHDAQVYRWFLLLLEQRAVREKLAVSPENKERYLSLNRCAVIQAVHGVSGFLILGIIRETREHVYALLLPFVIYGLFRALIRKKDLVARLSRELLARDFPDGALEKKTLYQLAEIYGRDLAIPSLVDTIFHWDRILQVTALLALFTATVVFPSKIWECSLFLLFSLALASALIRARSVYQRLK